MMLKRQFSGEVLKALKLPLNQPKVLYNPHLFLTFAGW